MKRDMYVVWRSWPTSFALTTLCFGMALGAMGTAWALDSSELLFHLSVEAGVTPDLARGSAVLAVQPERTSERLVDGIIGQGYAFAGKGSTLTFHSAENGTRGCAEMYGPRINVRADRGSISFWYKPLANSHNMAHRFLYMWPLQVTRNQYMHHWISYNVPPDGLSGRAVLYDDHLSLDKWHHVVMTWREDEVQGYFNGNLLCAMRDVGVMTQTPATFDIASEALTWLDFQEKEFADDAVMDEVQIFNRPISAEEVRALFERGHYTTTDVRGNGRETVTMIPQRAWEVSSLNARHIPEPPVIDGDLTEWRQTPANGAFTEIRLGILDADPGRLQLACDERNLYLAFYAPADSFVRENPVYYPNGQFKAGAVQQDGDVLTDDYVEFVLKDMQGNAYSYALNARGTLLDRRNGDSAWQSAGQHAARTDSQGWALELAIPLAEIAAGSGQAVDIMVNRSWKLFRSSQNTLFPGTQYRPAFAALTVGATGAAGISEVALSDGKLTLKGFIQGVNGACVVSVRGKGYQHDFDATQTITCAGTLTPFSFEKALDQPGDIGLVVKVNGPDGEKLLTRSLAVVHAAGTRVELANYPGRERLEVLVAPMPFADDLRASVALVQQGQEVVAARVESFAKPEGKVTFDTTPLAVGAYEVITRVYRGENPVFEDKKVYEKKPLPEWYGNQIAIRELPPHPWTPVQVQNSTVRLLLKNIRFDNTLFPAQIMSNGHDLLRAPVRLRATREGVEKVLAAARFKIVGQTDRRVAWQAVAEDGDLEVTVKGWIAYDGFTWMEITFAGGTLDRAVLEIPLNPDCATLKTLGRPGLVGNDPIEAPGKHGGYWFGNEHAGLQYFWEGQNGWVLNNEPVMITPSANEVVITVPFIQKPVTLTESRTVNFSWAVTPTKPRPEREMFIKLYKGVGYYGGDYTWVTPNYPQPLAGQESYDRLRLDLEREDGPIQCWYAFGPYTWVGSPEYAEWWREWRWPNATVMPPDPKSRAWAPASHASSASDMHIWMLDRFIKEYPQRGIYFDCMQMQGGRLATRRHYERIYTLFAEADPQYGWVRHHDWGPDMSIAAFCDDNWIGEGHIAPLIGSPTKNYFDVVDIPYARTMFAAEFGHLTSWLTELGATAGEDREARAGIYGKMIEPPKDGQPGKWTLPRWPDYEHVAGLGVVHNIWQIGGNDLQLPWMWVLEIQRRMRWDDSVRFIGYWDAEKVLGLEGGVAEKIVASLYTRAPDLPPPETPLPVDPAPPASSRRFTIRSEADQYLRAAGEAPEGWLVVALMNNTSEPAEVTVRPDLESLGFAALANGRFRDLYRAFTFTWQGMSWWRANGGDPEPPCITIEADTAVFPLQDGAARVILPRRSFRLLLLEQGAVAL